MRLRLVVVALFSCLLTTALAEEHTTKRIAKQPLSETAAPVPRTLEQMPAVPPQVTYQGGQLTITARNSTLGEILKAVHAQTGAEIDLPGPGNDRVVGSFGPGPARDVLATLLYGSHFNYVLLGSETDPQSLNRVMLFVKTAASESAPAETASAAAYQDNIVPDQNVAHRFPIPPRPAMPAPGVANQQVADAGDDADAQADDDSTDADDQTDDQADDQSETVQGEEPGQVKSPEQMLQELQQQQQQQQNQPGMQPGTQPGFPGGIRPGFPPGMQPGVPPGQGPQQQQ